MRSPIQPSAGVVHDGRAAAARARSLTRKAALPVGTVGVALGCMAAWRHTLHAGIFDDTFWAMADGRWMLDHHRVMTHDVFSYTVHGHPWTTPEYGYDLLLAEGVRLFGVGWFWFMSAGVATLTVLLVTARARLLGASWLWTGLLGIEVGVAVTLYLDVRPQVVSYLFTALLLLLLTVARRRRRVLWAVPVLFALWANLHGSFLLGLGILLLEVLAAAVPEGWQARLRRTPPADPFPRRAALVVLVVSGAATLVNPFGPGVYASALGVTFNSTIRRLIGEWQSPDFHDPATMLLVVLPIAVVGAHLAWSDRPLAAQDLALASVLLVATLDGSRFLPYFAIAACGLLALASPLRQEQLRPTLLTWPLLAVLGVGLLHGPWVPAGQIADSVPVRAVRYLEAHPGRVFSTYLWNDYLDWTRIPVFVDGRTELYTSHPRQDPILDQYLQVRDLTVAPDSVLRPWRVAYVLWPAGAPLARYLAHDPSWRVVRRSERSVILRSHWPSHADGAKG